jgi:orotidine 5'-phosphate decarboxylase
LVNSSRGIIYASSEANFAEIAGEKAKELQQEMEKELDKLKE